MLACCLVPGTLAADAYDDGIAALAAHDEGRAALAFRRALTTLPASSEKRVEALYRLSRLEVRLDERLRLLGELVNTGRGHARYATGALELATLLLAGNRLDEAERAVLPLRLDRESREAALMLLARIAVAGRRVNAALGWIDAFVAGYPRSAGMAAMLYCRGEAYRLNGDPRRAAEAYGAVLSRYGDAAEAAACWLALGELDLEAGDARQATERFRRLVAAFPQSVEASLARARLNVLDGEGRRSRQMTVYEVQLATFPLRGQAERFSSTLGAKGYISFIQEETAGTRRQFTVRMGYFRTQADAETIRRELAGKGHPGFIRTRTITVAEGDFG